MNIKPCGLIGMPLEHSFSPMIHSLLADYEYQLFPLEANEARKRSATNPSSAPTSRWLPQSAVRKSATR